MMDIYKEIREILNSMGIESNENNFGDEYFDDSVFKQLTDNFQLNKKGENFIDRFRDVLSDPNNLFIDRCENAGCLIDNTIVMHNGLKIFNNCYYESFTDCLILNRGVHEPSEERSFHKVLHKIEKNATMVELGSYWAFYSMWFKSFVNNGSSFCIEADPKYLKVGQKNFELNGFQGSFTQGFVGKNGIDLKLFFEKNNINYIDILHSDIQGSEFEMLCEIESYLKEKRVKYLFISTHSNDLHYKCMEFLKNIDYRIICSCDFDNQTFQYDGFFLSCPSDLNEISNFEIGDRSSTRLISQNYFNKIYKNYMK